MFFGIYLKNLEIFGSTKLINKQTYVTSAINLNNSKVFSLQKKILRAFNLIIILIQLIF
jgi:hypothetical protein